MDTTTAEVRLHNRRVGHIAYWQGGSEFHYEDDLSRPDHKILGQVFEDDPRKIRSARVGLPAWFANLLPEGALRRQIVRELGGGNIGDFTLLLRVGSNLPGAVTVSGDHEPEGDMPPHDPDGQLPDHPLRHSLAGVQLKYSISADRLSVPVSGDGGWWIVKLPDQSLRELPANEFVTMRWMAAAGFPVPAVELIAAREVAGLADGIVDPADLVYVINRFDRVAQGKVHVEDFAQVADVDPRFKYSESNVSYDTLASAIRQLAGKDGYDDFIRRLVAMLVVGNTDAHLKNWALIYRDGRTADLAPVYDFHSLTVYRPYRYQPLALSLNGEKVPWSIRVDDFRRMADRIGADPARTADLVAETVSRLRDAWRAGMVDEATRRFPPLAEHYSHRLESLPICRHAD
ncbi:type II toxin-antitoxin system HipA family toxin [Micromonospora carbonacea]|uniref:type II toxin-antitoxin system HipA family toxin n=1 Tax=Micromonospora carbonacea TaxID=47853 RepID=UPI003D7579D1